VRYLHINQWDTRGGSARVSLRLHQEMTRLGVDSHLMVYGRTGIPRLPVPGSSLLVEESWCRWIDNQARIIQKALHREDRFYASTWMLPLRSRFRNADVVQIYGLSGGYFSFSALPILSSRKPLIWWLTDPWQFTGNCCYPGSCKQWMTGCTACVSCSTDSERKAIERNWKLKKVVYNRTQALVVAPSKWLYNLAKQSPIMKHFRIEYVPNGVETEVFRPLDRQVMRRLWNVPEDVRCIMISTSTFSDPRKGSQQIGPILEKVKGLSGGMNIHVLFVGRRHAPLEQLLSQYFPFTPTGFIEEARLMATLYNAADLLLHPSLDENLSNMTCDCMSSGTPVFCFDVGGMRDIIADGRNGLASPAGDCNGLARGVVDYLKGEYLPPDVRQVCADIIRRRHTVANEAAQILKLAEALIEERQTKTEERS